MPLHELSADQLLAHMDKRGAEYAATKYAATLAEGNHQRAKASVYQSLRSGGGISVEDAKAQALSNETVTKTFIEMIEHELKKDVAYLALERARVAVELWRSEQANLRRI